MRMAMNMAMRGLNATTRNATSHPVVSVRRDTAAQIAARSANDHRRRAHLVTAPVGRHGQHAEVGVGEERESGPTHADSTQRESRVGSQC